MSAIIIQWTLIFLASKVSLPPINQLATILYYKPSAVKENIWRRPFLTHQAFLTVSPLPNQNPQRCIKWTSAIFSVLLEKAGVIIDERGFTATWCCASDGLSPNKKDDRALILDSKRHSWCIHCFQGTNAIQCMTWLRWRCNAALPVAPGVSPSWNILSYYCNGFFYCLNWYFIFSATELSASSVTSHGLQVIFPW